MSFTRPDACSSASSSPDHPTTTGSVNVKAAYNNTVIFMCRIPARIAGIKHSPKWPATLELANFRNAGGDVMPNFVLQAATFLIVATAAFSQKPGVPASTSEVSQKDEQQIRQLETEMLKGEMNSDPAVVEKIYADDCVLLPGRPGWTKAGLVESIRKSQGQAPPYIASQEDMHIYMLGDTAIVMYVKKYVVRANPDQVDRQDQTEVFLRSDGTWKLKISRSSPHNKTGS
jgi:ketosteroid isomerase-like protein